MAIREPRTVVRGVRLQPDLHRWSRLLQVRLKADPTYFTIPKTDRARRRVKAALLQSPRHDGTTAKTEARFPAADRSDRQPATGHQAGATARHSGSDSAAGDSGTGGRRAGDLSVSANVPFARKGNAQQSVGLQSPADELD